MLYWSTTQCDLNLFNLVPVHVGASKAFGLGLEVRAV